MIRIAEDTPRQSSRKMTVGEIEYYESLEAEFRLREAEKASTKAVVDELQAQCNRGLSRAIRNACSPESDVPVWVEEMEEALVRKFRAFQDARNAVPSPRWENELKAKFGKGT